MPELMGGNTQYRFNFYAKSFERKLSSIPAVSPPQKKPKMQFVKNDFYSNTALTFDVRDVLACGQYGAV